MQRRRTETDPNVLAVCRHEAAGWRVMVIKEQGDRGSLEGHFVVGTDAECSSRLEAAKVERARPRAPERTAGRPPSLDAPRPQPPARPRAPARPRRAPPPVVSTAD